MLKFIDWERVINKRGLKENVWVFLGRRYKVDIMCGLGVGEDGIWRD